MSKENEIVNKMVDECPYRVPFVLYPYIEEAMQIHAKQAAIGFAEWCNEECLCLGENEWGQEKDNYHKRYTTEQLYQLYLQSLK